MAAGLPSLPPAAAWRVTASRTAPSSSWTTTPCRTEGTATWPSCAGGGSVMAGRAVKVLGSMCYGPADFLKCLVAGRGRFAVEEDAGLAQRPSTQLETQ